MSFAIINSYRIVQKKQLYPISNKNNQFPLMLDLIFISGTLALAGLKFGKVWNFGLPADKSSLATDLAIGCLVLGSISLGGAIIVAKILKQHTSEGHSTDFPQPASTPITNQQSLSTQMCAQAMATPSNVPGTVAKGSQVQPMPIPALQTCIPKDKIAQIKREISAAPESIACPLHTRSHPICEGIFLGNQQACIEVLREDNPDKISIVITLCNISEIDRPPMFSDHGKIVNNRAEWFLLGNMLVDHSDAWVRLVSNCTYGNPDFFSKNFPNKRSDWFKYAFTQLDRAFIADHDGGTKKILVHCFAGISRSATLLAAYFINRFDVSAEQALNFLRSRRSCVDSKFVQQLQEYEHALREERTQEAST